jgi:hypothetical protein
MDRLRPKEFVSDIAAARNYNLNQNNSHAEITKHFRSARCNKKLALDTLRENHTKIWGVPVQEYLLYKIINLSFGHFLEIIL